MKYFSFRKWDELTEEIPASKAKELLTGYWNEELLADLFGKRKPFRLWTPYRFVWTEDCNGNIPEGAYYGE